LDIHLQSVTQRAGEKNALNAEVIGTVDDRPVTLQAQIKPFTQLLAAREVEFRINADLGVLSVAADGRVDDLLEPKQPRLQLTTEAAEIAQLTAMLALPQTITGALALNASIAPADDRHVITVAGSIGPYNLDARAHLQTLDSIDGLAIDLAADGPDLKTAANLAGVAGLPALPFEIRSQAALSGSRLEILETRFETGDNHLTLSGVMTRFPKLEGTTLDLDVQGKNYLEFAELLGLTAAKQLQPAPFEFSGDLEYSARDKQMFSARAALGNIVGEFHGQLTEYPTFTGSRLSFLVNGPDSTVILSALGRPATVKESYILRGDVERTSEGFAIERGALLLGASELHVDGTIGNDPLRENTALSVRFQTPDIGKIAGIAGYTGFVPQGDTKIVFDANAEPDGLHITALSADIGRNSLQASGLVSLQADLAGSRFDLAMKSADIAEVLPPELLPYVHAGESFDIAGRLETQPDRLAIKSLSATLGDVQLDASGGISMQQPLQESAFTVAIRGANLAKVIPEQLVTYDIPQAEFSVSGNFALNQNRLELDNVKAAVGPDRARVSGVVPLKAPTEGLRVEITVSGPNLAALVPPELKHLDIEASPYEITSDIELANGRLSMERLSFSIAKGSIRGDVSVALQDPRSFGQFDLTGSGINLEEFVPTLPTYQPAAVPFELAIRGGWDADTATIEKAHVDLDQTTLDLQGVIDLPPNMTATQLKLSARGDSLADFGQIPGVVLPPDAFQIDVALQGSAEKLELTKLDARLGDSDLNGSFSIIPGEKPEVDIKLQSNLLDLTRLLPEQKQETPDEPQPEPVSGRGRVIPDLPTQGKRLNSINVAMLAKVGELRLPGHTLRDIDINATLSDGDLSVTRFNATASRGEIIASFRTTATDDRVVTSGSLEGKGIVLGQGAETESGRRLPEGDFHLQFQTEGSTTRELAANLSGSATVTGGEGRLENTGAMRLVGDFATELLSMINPFVKNEPYTHISCTAFFADITDGLIVISPGAVVQTDKLNIFADGQIDLKSERISLRFNTAARTGIGVSVADFVNPFVGVGGTLAKPRLGLDPKSSALEGGVAYATGGMSIVARSLFRRWLGAKDPCAELAKQAQKLRAKQEKEQAKNRAKETGQ
ncbi:MAG: hypothetical protein OET44_09100, partial [Gammaproteobacteria bacterium]|nr:hypothetical protein [Gammaproteobacteria bacterium]